MYNYLTRACSLLLLLSALVGCSSGATPSGPTPVASPAVVSTDAPVATPVPTLPPTETPAPTLEPSATPEPSPTPEPTTAAPAAITGSLALVRGSLTERPFAVMLDNHPDAYPQAGMSSAVIVF
ncbi:MAG: DUF3048 domain-containing protein, partial [Oscillochloris sp.]|nr:DUF3048 domain-containing protein [Oscillochloris sp.]